MFSAARILALLPLVLLTLWSPDAFACKCEKSINPVSGSTMVFWGKATEIKSRGAQDRVKFEVSHVYKGDEERPEVMVYTNRFHHDCGLRLEAEKTYMVYAYDFYPRGVATSMCWGTYEAEEAVPDDKWKDVKVDVPDDTKLELALRKIAKDVVPACGAPQRLFDAGFSMVLSPDGDPVRIAEDKKPSDKLDAFRSCVLDKMLAADNLPKPDKPTEIHGWYQRDVGAQPVLLDEIPCGDSCRDFGTLVRAPLMVTTPTADDQVGRNILTERAECITGGISAVGAESHGAPRAIRMRNRMLADCAAQRGEFDQASPYLESITNPVIVAALTWGAAVGKPENTYPLGDEKSFPSEAIDGKADASKYRDLRAGFISDPYWAQSPLYLEAFAQSVLVDPSAPEGMKDLASLALHRAGILLPAAADAYSKLADAASSSARATELRGQLDAEFAKLEVSAEPEVEEVVEEDAEVVEAAPEEKGQDPMLLVVAGVLIAVAVAGIVAILKRRR